MANTVPEDKKDVAAKEMEDIPKTRHQVNSDRIGMNQNTNFHVVLDIDGTTPPIKVVSGSDDQYFEAIKKRCKKTGDFRKSYRKPEEPPETLPETVKKQVTSCCQCDKESQKKFWQKRFPVWKIMRKYKIKDDLPNDIVSGLTVGIMQLPQGMAYALLAELPPVVGLYMAFFPVLIYFLLGSSKHISMGTVALCSLLTGSVISRFYDPALAKLVMPEAEVLAEENMTLSSADALADDPLKVELTNEVKMGIAASLCLLVGIVQFIMGIFRLGFITTYMSDPLIGGFTTGAAVHVGTSQVKYALGLHIPRSDGTFQIIKTYILIFKHITQVNLPTIIMSVICMIILYIIKVHVNLRYKHKLKFPVPVELFVVVGGTLASYFLNFSEKYHMKIVGEIPRGLPEPSFPKLIATNVYTTDAVVIAMVAFSQCVGLAALMAKKHGYSYDSNQELIAYGAGNIFGSMFSCYPYAASVSRSSVQDSAGGRTQLASVVSATLVLIVILSIGPLFETLPNCVLAAIILVALRSLFLQFFDLPKIYRTSAYDFKIENMANVVKKGLSRVFKKYRSLPTTASLMWLLVRICTLGFLFLWKFTLFQWIWIVTFLCTVILHVDYGIILGIIFSFFTVVIRTQRTKAENLEKIENVHIFEDSTKYKQTATVDGIRVIGFTSPLYYANGALFVSQVYNLTGIKPEARRKQLKKLGLENLKFSSRNRFVPLVNETNELESMEDLRTIATNPAFQASPRPSIDQSANDIMAVIAGPGAIFDVILDFSAVTFIDTVGAKVLKQIVEDYSTVHVKVVLSCVNDEVWRVLEATDFLDQYEDRIFLTTDDAMASARLNAKVEAVSELKYPQRMMYRENNNPDAGESEALLGEDSNL